MTKNFDHKKEFLKYFAGAWEAMQEITGIHGSSSDYNHFIEAVDDYARDKKNFNSEELDVFDLVKITVNEFILKCLEHPYEAGKIDYQTVLSEEWSLARQRWGNKTNRHAYNQLMTAIEGCGDHYGRIDWELIARLALLQCFKKNDN